MHRMLLTVLLLAVPLVGAAGESDTPQQLPVPGGTFESVLPVTQGVSKVVVPPFRIDRGPVTNGQFAGVVATHQEWGRDRVPCVVADQHYPEHWRNASIPEPGSGQQPVTQVSWFAATAYCEARGARLPRWYEWELAAAASEHATDARKDPEWRQRILDWYSVSGAGRLPDVGSEPPNVYGVQDLHGVVWEWVEDAAGILASDDSREQGDPNLARFCGSGALTLQQKDNYAMLMRVAMLSSMKAAYTSLTMG